MDDGNIAPENPSKQEPNQCNKRVETSQSNNKDVRRPTKMPETDNPGGSTANRGHEHHRSIRRCSVREKDGHAASVVPSEIAAPETTTVHASSSNGPSSPPPWPVSSAVSGINSHAACKSYQWSAKKLEFGILTYESVR